MFKKCILVDKTILILRHKFINRVLISYANSPYKGVDQRKNKIE